MSSVPGAHPDGEGDISEEGQRYGQSGDGDREQEPRFRIRAVLVPQGCGPCCQGGREVVASILCTVASGSDFWIFENRVKIVFRVVLAKATAVLGGILVKVGC